MISTNRFNVEVIGKRDSFWVYSCKGQKYHIQAPVFSLNGIKQHLELKSVQPATIKQYSPGIEEYRYGAHVKGLDLRIELVFRIASASSIIRFFYVFDSASLKLTKVKGRDQICYFGLAPGPDREYLEVRLSDFDEMIHSYKLNEEPMEEKSFANELSVMGPIICASDREQTMLCAYEHGSSCPDRFLEYQLYKDRSIKLNAVKGNHYNGQLMEGYETLIFEFGAVEGSVNDLAAHYRDFVLNWLSPNRESRQPYIFYNTWNNQERQKAWGQGKYLDPIRESHMLDEIDVAHRMGVDVFVIDTGWYGKTGDWRVNREFFPHGLGPIKKRLDKYGMKLGLWFSPTEAAVSSEIAARNSHCLISWDGRVSDPSPVWETEESYKMCLVSEYWEDFTNELIRYVSELEVTYFKWDAIGQYGCNDSGHFHGGHENSERERADCYAFEQVRYMSRIVDKLCAACPEVIVDFDITENGRSMGLAFLASGKYFLINNGPYYRNYDDPQYAPGGGMGSNIFVFPGPARPRLCRHPLTYDRWIPSVLFLTHFLPDDPEQSQIINIASMILGQNGIWGDLMQISEEGVARFGTLLGHYKDVRDNITQAESIRSGFAGCTPEIHEKISSEKGVVLCFSERGNQIFRYVSTNRVEQRTYATPGVSVAYNSKGQAVIDFSFSEGGAQIVFFGS